jgi:hypothetical protein
MKYQYYLNLPSINGMAKSLIRNNVIGSHDDTEVELFEYSAYNLVFSVKNRQKDNAISIFVLHGMAWHK